MQSRHEKGEKRMYKITKGDIEITSNVLKQIWEEFKIASMKGNSMLNIGLEIKSLKIALALIHRYIIKNKE